MADLTEADLDAFMRNAETAREKNYAVVNMYPSEAVALVALAKEGLAARELHDAVLAATDPSNWDDMSGDFYRGFYDAMIETILPILNEYPPAPQARGEGEISDDLQAAMDNFANGGISKAELDAAFDKEFGPPSHDAGTKERKEGDCHDAASRPLRQDGTAVAEPSQSKCEPVAAPSPSPGVGELITKLENYGMMLTDEAATTLKQQAGELNATKETARRWMKHHKDRELENASLRAEIERLREIAAAGIDTGSVLTFAREELGLTLEGDGNGDGICGPRSRADCGGA